MKNYEVNINIPQHEKEEKNTMLPHLKFEIVSIAFSRVYLRHTGVIYILLFTSSFIFTPTSSKKLIH